jgi:hypothetical protein
MDTEHVLAKAQQQRPKKSALAQGAYTHHMAPATTPAATWTLDETVDDRMAESRHSCSAPKAHQLTPPVTNHRRATP